MFKGGYFPPLKHLSSVNVSKSKNQSAVVHKVTIHKSLNSFVAHIRVSVVSHNCIRPVVTSKLVCNVLSKLVKCKDACESVFNVTRKPVKSEVAFKPVSNISSKLVKSNFTCKSVSNVPGKNVTPSVSQKPISKVTHKLSNSFVRKSASLVSDSPDPSFTCKQNLQNIFKTPYQARVTVPEPISNLSNKSLNAHAVCKFLTNVC